MNTETRMDEIMSSIKSASKETYHKSEILPELLALQQEIVALTFNSEHAELANLRFWDVEKHLDEMNNNYGGIATEELRRFKSGCAFICNLIKAEFSGNRGENKAFYALERMRTEHLILRNVELTDGNRRTEIDAVVITHKGAFIIEVKNTHKDIFIAENGDYYRTGEYTAWDSNIGKKLTLKRDLLQKVLHNAALDNVEIFEIVVFTNNHIEVHNRCSQIKTSFLDLLPHIIENWGHENTLSTSDMNQASVAIENARCEMEYPLEFDTEQFKRDFASVMVKLEIASQSEEEMPNPTATEQTMRSRIHGMLKTIFTAENMKAAGKTAGKAAFFAFTTAAVISKRKHNAYRR